MTGGVTPDGFPRAGNALGRAGAGPSGPARYLGAADRAPRSADLKPSARWTPAPGTVPDRNAAGVERRTRLEDGVLILDNDVAGIRDWARVFDVVATDARSNGEACRPQPIWFPGGRPAVCRNREATRDQWYR